MGLRANNGHAMGIEGGYKLMDGVVSASDEFGRSCADLASRGEDLASEISDLREFFDMVADIRDRSLRGGWLSYRLSEETVADLVTRSRIEVEKIVRAREELVASKSGPSDAAERCAKVSEQPRG